MTPAKRSQPCGGRGVRAAERVVAERDAGASGNVPPAGDPRAGRCRGFRRRRPGRRTHVHDPVGVADDIEFVFDHEERIARGFQAVEGAQERLGVGGMQPGGGFVEHVDDAEEVRAHLRGQPQALQFPGRERGGAAFQGQVAQPEIEQDQVAAQEVFGDAPGDDGFLGGVAREFFQRRRRAVRVGAQDRRQLLERHPGNVRDVQPGERDRERFAPQPFAVAERTIAAEHELRDAPFAQRALGVRKGVQHVPPRARERAHVAGLHFRLERAAHLRRVETGVHRHGGLLLGEENPVAVLLRQLAPRAVHVVAERHEDFALVLPAPGGRPRRDGALADGQGWVGHHGGFGDLVHPAQAVALRASALGGVRRERFRVEERLTGRVVARAGVEHPQQVGERGDAADTGTGGRRAALLLQGDGRGQTLDLVDLRHGHLVEKPPRVGRHGFEITPLRLRVERAESQRRFAGTRHAGEDHQGVAGDFQIDVLEVVLTRAAHPDESGGSVVRRGLSGVRIGGFHRVLGGEPP